MVPIDSPSEINSWSMTKRSLYGLMPFRVREILLISSNYDAFILEEDGGLTDRIFLEYSELHLTAAPRITHANTVERGLSLLEQRRFDMVLTAGHGEDFDAAAVCREVRKTDAKIPLALLLLTEVEQLPDSSLFDGIFLWTGDTRMLLAVIKLIEDSRNIEHDIELAGVQVILVVEDSIRQYTSFLALLYSELMIQSQSLIAEGLNPLHKLMRMRTRPKILLAGRYEDAVAYYQRFQDHIMAVISDVRFPRNNKMDSQAGYELVKYCRAQQPELPIFLQSSEPDLERRAHALGVLSANKHAHLFQKRLQNFLLESLGFGPFVFRLPNRTEVGRANDVFEMEQLLKHVPAASLEFHANNNHISTWLRARSRFELARNLRPRTVHEFGGVEKLREHLVRVLRDARRLEQQWHIQDYVHGHTDSGSLIVRLSSGSLGGKGRGIAFANAMLKKHNIATRFEGLEIRIPKTLAIGVDAFEHFVASASIQARVLAAKGDQEIIERCLAGKLSGKLIQELYVLWKDLKGPLAVRSSSLLEDSHTQPFAGIYGTYLLPNNQENPEVRFSELVRAIKAVYASTFARNARTYLSNTPYSPDDEKMGVVIQELVGEQYADRFYPNLSGVAMSYNYYPAGTQRAEEGVVLMALGLGRTVVQGGNCLRFSPASPQVLPQFSTAEEVMKNGQLKFFALKTTMERIDFSSGTGASLIPCSLADAEADGSLGFVGSVFCSEDNMIRDNLKLPGPRVVTFNNILKWNDIPLAEALSLLLKQFREDLGRPVEIEFAISMGDRGKRLPKGQSPRPPCLYVLQVRPLPSSAPLEEAIQEHASPERILVQTNQALGHAVFENIRDIVYVKSRMLRTLPTADVAREISAANAILQSKKCPYLLIGPGRWGSSDPYLGIPVEWADIAGVKVIVETNFADRPVEPSMGAHFFKNITALRKGYLTLGHIGGRPGTDRGYIDLDWLDAQPALQETDYIRVVQLEDPLRVVLDGREGKGMVLKPEKSA